MFLQHLYDKHEQILLDLESDLLANEEFTQIGQIMAKLEQLPDKPEDNQIYYVYYKEDVKWLLGKYLKEKYDLDYYKRVHS